jgi:ADP-ribose pyrophosphatase
MEENPWKTLASDVVYENNWIRVVENKVINPAGNNGIYGVVHFKNIAIAVIPLDEDENTWLVGQYRYTLNSYEWEVPEGGCPEHEDPEEAARRELQEETGLIAGRLEQVLQMQLSNSVSDEVSYTFLARQLKVADSTPEETEKLQVKKVPFSEAYRMVIEGEIRDALSVASILKVKTMLDKR